MINILSRRNSTRMPAFLLCRIITNRLMETSSKVQLDEATIANTSSYETEERGIGKTQDEQHSRLKQAPIQPTEPRSLNVAVIGAPNHGKSTLTNTLMKWKVCSVSSKVHTTRDKQMALLNEGNVQIKFLDTPGVISATRAKKCKLDFRMVEQPQEAAGEADLLLVVVDASNKLSSAKLPGDVVALLDKFKHIPSILVLNKIDIVHRKERLLNMVRTLTADCVGGEKVNVGPATRARGTYHDVTSEMFARAKDFMKKVKREDREGVKLDEQTVRSRHEEVEMPSQQELLDKREEKYDLRRYDSDKRDEDGLPMFLTLVSKSKRPPQRVPIKRGWPQFDRVFMVSALTADGVQELKSYLLQSSKHRDWEYNRQVVTDLSPYRLVLMTLRGKFLDALQYRLPYKLHMTINYWKYTDSGVLEIFMCVSCKEDDSYMRSLIGEGGKVIEEVCSSTQQDLMSLFRCEVQLKVSVLKHREMGLNKPNHARNQVDDQGSPINTS